MEEHYPAADTDSSVQPMLPRVQITKDKKVLIAAFSASLFGLAATFLRLLRRAVILGRFLPGRGSRRFLSGRNAMSRALGSGPCRRTCLGRRVHSRPGFGSRTRFGCAGCGGAASSLQDWGCGCRRGCCRSFGFAARGFGS